MGRARGPGGERAARAQPFTLQLISSLLVTVLVQLPFVNCLYTYLQHSTKSTSIPIQYRHLVCWTAAFPDPIKFITELTVAAGAAQEMSR